MFQAISSAASFKETGSFYISVFYVTFVQLAEKADGPKMLRVTLIGLPAQNLQNAQCLRQPDSTCYPHRDRYALPRLVRGAGSMISPRVHPQGT